MDLDLVLTVDSLTPLTAESSLDDKRIFEKWERSNRMSRMIIKGSIPEAFRGALSDDITKAKEFLAELEKCFVKNDKNETKEEDRLKQEKVEIALFTSTSKDLGKKRKFENKAANQERSRGFKFYNPAQRNIFEIGTATFFEDVEFGGRNVVNDITFEEESVSTPIVDSGAVVDPGNVQVIMALVAHFDLELHQMDVKTVFLNGNIDEMIYMVHLENFESGDPKNMVNDVDDCVYHKFSGSKFIFLVLYVDDILPASNDIDILHETKKFLSKKFEMKDLGDASFVLGIQIYRDRSRSILGLS
ncbi:hypothetical protein LIER_16997 [Lithospermum erythrorhizon]|uniref:Reverse transcriptase Ty1/copia-type domain-containing protein n=1 Tax=Lithospermum erythrorhizon TaxID=34254 RepID=A0AAV3QBY9_LITER